MKLPGGRAFDVGEPGYNLFGAAIVVVRSQAMFSMTRSSTMQTR
jgi:hypothetical protein